MRWNTVYPACAGIDLRSKSGKTGRRCLPRMRGDRPQPVLTEGTPTTFTPHARGSTCCRMCYDLHTIVYPACAGIDPRKEGPGRYVVCLPRMRGDRPSLAGHLLIVCEFTPHARGSTGDTLTARVIAWVYPACAGIDPPPVMWWESSMGLPRMRGDRPRSSSCGPGGL